MNKLRHVTVYMNSIKPLLPYVYTSQAKPAIRYLRTTNQTIAAMDDANNILNIFLFLFCLPIFEYDENELLFVLGLTQHL